MFETGKPAPNRGKGVSYSFLCSLVGFKGQACVTWPFNRVRGYGQLGHEGKMHKAHRLMCELAHGQAPSPVHEAAHSCGRGHEGCVNPNHLSWKTRTENQRDRRKHGTEGRQNRGQPRFKLNPESVSEIRSLAGKATVTDLADRFKVTRSTIRQIHLGKIWTKDRVHLSDDDVREIRRIGGSLPASKVAKRFGINESRVYKIRYGTSYRHVS